MYQPIPDSTILLFKNIPLDKTYNHTVLWQGGAAAQTAYFTSKTFLRVEKATYVRETGNIFIEAPRDTLTGVNYIAYRNTSYTNKWFYAFVDALYYRNDNVTEIKFTLDVMQSYLYGLSAGSGDWTAKSAYIERETTATDEIGDHILPEPIEAGERVAPDVYKPAFFQNWDVIAFSGVDESLNYAASHFEPGNPVFSGLKPITVGTGRGLALGANNAEWDITTTTPFLQRVISDTTRDLSKVVSNITMVPSVFASGATGSGVQMTVNKPTANYAIGVGREGYYIPKNRKLYTKQYVSLFVTDGNGGGKEYAFEDFTDATAAEFNVFCDKSANPSLIAIPNGYRCERGTYNSNESVIMNNLPQCSWTSDGFAAWLGNTSQLITPIMAAETALIHTVAPDMFQSMGASTRGEAVKAISEGFQELVQDASKSDLFKAIFRAKDVPITNGNTSGTALMAVAAKAFICYTLTPKAANARVIDDYFTRYGYNVQRIGVPDLFCRPHFKYIKTREIQVDGGAPAEVLKAIEALFNRGITFWYNPDEVGDYTLNNQPA